ncbi:hypothetical protein SAMN04487967_1700 [Natronorubrum sediminis]|uniref:Uncharacterized protein n=1 Tax=Natronorubrum sediminis TaxID=640943 RepID=A0A1H6FXA3_9EURY|nr:hypothetical protein [Natronorubrum sediminis]SEH14643.1 hypothetical protein SAMN04487967_1700 [Natronorubrum sediminis]
MQKIKAIVGGILAVIIVSLGVFIYASYTGIVEPMLVSAVATAALVLVTAVSVTLTLVLLSEERRARQQEIMPVFKLELKGFYLGHYGIALKNIGNGPAQNVEVNIELQSEKENRTITYPNVAPGNSIPVPEPFEEVKLEKDRFDEFGQITVKGTCEDVTGEEQSISDTYDFQKHANQPGWAPGNETIEDYLDDIVDELDDIEGEISDVESEIKSLR